MDGRRIIPSNHVSSMADEVSPADLLPYVYSYLLKTKMLKAANSLKKEASASGVLEVRHASLFIICSAILLCMYTHRHPTAGTFVGFLTRLPRGQ